VARLEIFAWHPFSGGYRKPIEAAIYKGLGARAGLPDVLVLHNGRVFGLELKADGRQADAEAGLRRLQPCRWPGPSLASLSGWMPHCAGLRSADCSAAGDMIGPGKD
jgi:hypothetical protein